MGAQVGQGLQPNGGDQDNKGSEAEKQKPCASSSSCPPLCRRAHTQIYYSLVAFDFKHWNTPDLSYFICHIQMIVWASFCSCKSGDARSTLYVITSCLFQDGWLFSCNILYPVHHRVMFWLSISEVSKYWPEIWRWEVYISIYFITSSVPSPSYHQATGRCTPPAQHSRTCSALPSSPSLHHCFVLGRRNYRIVWELSFGTLLGQMWAKGWKSKKNTGCPKKCLQDCLVMSSLI